MAAKKKGQAMIRNRVAASTVLPRRSAWTSRWEK